MKFLNLVYIKKTLSYINVNLFSVSKGIQDREKLRKALFSLVALRVFLLTTILSISVWEVLSNGMTEIKANSALWLFCLTYLISIINLFLIKKSKKPKYIGYGQLVVDVFLATCAIYITQSSVSTSLYLLAIMGASIIFGQNGAYILSALSGLSYACLFGGILSFLGLKNRDISTLDILGVYVSLVVIASISGYLEKKLEELTQLLENKTKALTSITEIQQQLLENVSQGVITLDLN